MGRVLFLTRSLEGGGAERQLILLASGLRQRGHDVTIAVLYRGGPLESEIEDTGVGYVCLEKQGFWDMLGFLLRTARAARRLNPDVLHGYMEVGNAVALGLRPFLRSTRVVWGVRASRLESEEYDAAGRLLARLLVPASRFVNLIICNSKAGALVVAERGYPRDRIVVIPNGIDTERFQPKPEDGQRLRASLGIGPSEVVIGIAARPDPMKDYGTFAAAASLLAAKRPDVTFLCAGDWVEPYRSLALTALQASGLGDRLRWLGFVRDMPAFYSALDVATSSSAFGEGVPNGVAEAMACGAPCVVTDVGDSRLVVGDLGVVVPPRNPHALAEGWSHLLGERGPGLSAACRERIVAEFGVDALVNRTESALQLDDSSSEP